MRFAISIPQHVPDGTFDPARLRDYLARAEELGLHAATAAGMRRLRQPFAQPCAPRQKY